MAKTKPIEDAQEHVRRKGHTLVWYQGPRPWSPYTLTCKNCKFERRFLKSDVSDPTGLLVTLNATPRELPTSWDRLLADKLAI